jgi:hypothetical protein
MHNKLKMAFGASALTLALAISPALSQMTDIGEWDTNGDAGLTNDEYKAGMGATGVFGQCDGDANEVLNEQEFQTCFAANQDEFAQRFGDDYYSQWDTDADSMINEDEFYEGTYGAYDADESGTIEEPELGDLGDDVGDGGIFDV